MTSGMRLTIVTSATAIAIGLVVGILMWKPWTGTDEGGRSEPATDASTVPSERQPGGALIGILATTDLGLGPNRISFLLEGPKGIIKIPEANVTPLYFPTDGSPIVAGESVTAQLHVWPFGTRANYSTQLFFDKPGSWALDVRVSTASGQASAALIPLKVAKASVTPPIGSGPPAGNNRTLRDVGSLSELTSWYFADPELYTTTIAEALASHRPLMLVFSSPSICTSPACGPQVDAVQEIKERYKLQANFIHVEVYDNPDEIQGDLNNARYSPVVEAWGLPGIEGYVNESWVFILDQEGRITSKYEGFASVGELEPGLRLVLE